MQPPCSALMDSPDIQPPSFLNKAADTIKTPDDLKIALYQSPGNQRPQLRQAIWNGRSSCNRDSKDRWQPRPTLKCSTAAGEARGSLDLTCRSSEEADHRSGEDDELKQVPKMKSRRAFRIYGKPFFNRGSVARIFLESPPRSVGQTHGSAARIHTSLIRKNYLAQRRQDAEVHIGPGTYTLFIRQQRRPVKSEPREIFPKSIGIICRPLFRPRSGE